MVDVFEFLSMGRFKSGLACVQFGVGWTWLSCVSCLKTQLCQPRLRQSSLGVVLCRIQISDSMPPAADKLKAQWMNIVAQKDCDTMMSEAMEVGTELAAHGHFFVGRDATNVLWTYVRFIRCISFTSFAFSYW